jgi:hypothetical protein
MSKNFIFMPLSCRSEHRALLELRFREFCKFYVTQKQMPEHIVFPVATTTKEAANEFCYDCEMQHDVLDMPRSCRKLGYGASYGLGYGPGFCSGESTRH